jgi:hypothetical protein
MKELGLDSISEPAHDNDHASDTTNTARSEDEKSDNSDYWSPDEVDEELKPDTVLVPLELAQNIGSVDGSANGGIIVGAVPVDDFMSQVIDPVIPTGEDYDPSDFLDMDRDELLDFIYEFATGETMADITLADGRKAVSAVVNYSAETSSF